MKLAKDRLYYSISDVADLLDLKPSIIRFWETEFALLKPLQKEKNSKRKFKIREIEILLKIKSLLYVEKFTIKGANDQLKNWKPFMSFTELATTLENGVILSSESNIQQDSESDKKNKKETSLPDLQISSKMQPLNRSAQIVEEIRSILTRIR